VRRSGGAVVWLLAIVVTHWIFSYGAELANSERSSVRGCQGQCPDEGLALWTPVVLAPYVVLAVGIVASMFRPGRRWSTWRRTLVTASVAIGISVVALYASDQAGDSFPDWYSSASRNLFNELNEHY
jgi:hypothetical protein